MNCLFRRSLAQLKGSRAFQTSPVQSLFYERSKKGDYEKEVVEKTPKTKLVLDGLKLLGSEIEMWKEEMRERIQMDPITTTRPGEVDVVFKFDEPEDLEKWGVTADSDHREGFSKVALEPSPAGFALFHGNVQSIVPRDGRVHRAGYCNMKSVRARKSFKRETCYDWTAFNMLVMKVRGDGRSYLLNLHCEGYFDMHWHDIYNYVLYTRGGPHWQYTRIPFSKFFLSSKGRVQDRQGPINLSRVTNVGISVGAKGGTEGPFSLEIGYIGLEFDPNHDEEFAYEMYRMPKYLVAE